MKQHKFKRIALDLIERISTDRFAVNYKYDVIWFYHFDEKYEKGIKSLSMFNNLDADHIILERYEHAKNLIKGEKNNATNSDISNQT